MDENGKNITNENAQNTTDQKMMYPPGIMPNLMPGMMPGMVPGMMPGPGMMGYGPQQYTYVTDPMAELTQSSGALIQQDLEMFEIISGCETQNRYRVFLQTTMGLKYAFKCIERSGCCSRVCCKNDCRGIKLDILHINNALGDSDLSKFFISAKKGCGCGFCCLCRPTLDINLSKDNSYLGRIREPCTCCDIKTEIYDKNLERKYLIIGNCCQYGLCCGSSAEKIAEIEFRIKKNGQTVGMMKKLSATMGEYISKADSYKISFPVDATAEEKMLLICAGLLIDYQNFEKNETPKQNRKHM